MFGRVSKRVNSCVGKRGSEQSDQASRCVIDVLSV